MYTPFWSILYSKMVFLICLYIEVSSKKEVYMSIIKIEKLTFAYPGSDNIFEDISFIIDTNWKIGLIGKNGIRKEYII